MLQFKCRLYVEVIGSDRTLYRDAVLPIPPFVGLTIGSQKVKEVLVSQGEDSDEIECWLAPIKAQLADYLISDRGWSELSGHE